MVYGGGKVGKLKAPLLIIFLLFSVAVLWGVGELFSSEEGTAAVSPGFQIAVFSLISLMTVVLITIYLKLSAKEGQK
jgi:hypothetical protein